MPYIHQARCTRCEYQSARLFLWLNEVVSNCQNCKELVAAEQGRFCDCNPYRCPKCGRELVENEDPPCPRCQGKLNWDSCHTSDYALNPWKPGMTLHFLRLGRQRSGRTYGMVRGCLVRLEGPTAREPGLWHGEGILLAKGRVRVVGRLSGETLLPKKFLATLATGDPWLSFDVSPVLVGLESKVLFYQKAFNVWALDKGLAAVCHLLITEPAEVHCLDGIYDGTQWHPWVDGLKLCLEYSQKRECWIAPELPPPGPGTISGTDYNSPFWVELWKGEVKLRRWNQTELLKMKIEARP
jgi:hypothetical protein